MYWSYPPLDMPGTQSSTVSHTSVGKHVYKYWLSADPSSFEKLKNRTSVVYRIVTPIAVLGTVLIMQWCWPGSELVQPLINVLYASFLSLITNAHITHTHTTPYTHSMVAKPDPHTSRVSSRIEPIVLTHCLIVFYGIMGQL